MKIFMKLTEYFKEMTLVPRVLFMIYAISTLQVWIGPKSRIIYTSPLDYFIAIATELAVVSGSLAIFGYLEAHPEKINWANQTAQGKAFLTKLLVRGAMIFCIFLMLMRWFERA